MAERQLRPIRAFCKGLEDLVPKADRDALLADRERLQQEVRLPSRSLLIVQSGSMPLKFVERLPPKPDIVRARCILLNEAS